MRLQKTLFQSGLTNTEWSLFLWVNMDILKTHLGFVEIHVVDVQSVQCVLECFKITTNVLIATAKLAFWYVFMWCVITYSLSRVLNYALIGHTVWISDVGEKDQDFIMMLLTLSRIALCLPEGTNHIWWSGIMYVAPWAKLHIFTSLLLILCWSWKYSTYCPSNQNEPFAAWINTLSLRWSCSTDDF